MKKDFRLGVEQLDSRVYLSSNPWYIESIKADIAWSQINSITKPVVAIVDSGMDLNHPFLTSNLFKNPLDPVDGKDNDNNGYVDDINGWDFVDNDNSPQDGFYHGTHVAGIVNSVGNNKISILPLRFMNNNGLGYTGAAANAIHYAVDLKLKGINIAAINCSFGGVLSNSNVLSSAIQRASDNGIVVVIAAGNDGGDLDVTPRYPGSLNYTNTITVAATNSDKSLAGYSNYGKNSVAIAAPGTNIYSTLPGGGYGNVSGTSMSAPMVSGAVGLLKSMGNYGANILKYAITKGSEIISQWSHKITNGLLDISASITILRSQVTQPIEYTPPVTPVVQPIVEQVKRLEYKLDYVNKNGLSGWSRTSNSNSKSVVEVYINGTLRYKTSANLYRPDTRRYDGFKVSINKKFLIYRSNLIEVRIKDSVSNLVSIAYKQYVRR